MLPPPIHRTWRSWSRNIGEAPVSRGTVSTRARVHRYNVVVPFVLVHGGGFAGSCWDDVVPLLPPPVIACDLPGRGTRARDLAELHVACLGDAVVRDIEANDLRDVVLVGHSMGGITLPSVMARVTDRLRHVVFVSCTVPDEGQRIVDTLDPAMREMAEASAQQPASG